MNLLPDITELSVDQIAVEARLRPFGMEPASASDVDHLSRIYARGLTLGPDLKAALLKASRGSIRNVSTNLAHVAEFGATRGLTLIGLAEWGSQPFHSGEAPPPRDLPAGLRRRGIAA